jgi:predicted O-methyltransferase YrrM
MHLLEIGAGAGGSHRIWMDASPEGADLTIIDWHSVVTPDIFLSWKKWYKPGQTTTLFYDSQKQETFEGVKAHLGSAKLDFLFIDGDHHYDCAKRDFEWYGSLVREGGLIAIHDTQAPAVRQLWNEITVFDCSATHKTEEYVSPEHPCGTGIYWKT